MDGPPGLPLRAPAPHVDFCPARHLGPRAREEGLGGARGVVRRKESGDQVELLRWERRLRAAGHEHNAELPEPRHLVQARELLLDPPPEVAPPDPRAPLVPQSPLRFAGPGSVGPRGASGRDGAWREWPRLS